MSALHDALAARANAIAASTPARPESAPDVIRSVKRRVRAKFAAGAGMALAVVMAVTVGAVLMLDREPTPPATTGSPSLTPSTTPSATPSASPTPEVTVDADGRALPGFVTIGEDLPSASPLPDGVLETSAPGWSLGVYRPRVEMQWDGSDDPNELSKLADPTYQVVYLADPEGNRFQLLELPPEPAFQLQSWTPGDARALVLVCDGDCGGTGTIAWLDLESGHLDTAPFDAIGVVEEVSYQGAVPMFNGETGLWAVNHDGPVKLSDENWHSQAMENDGTNPDETGTLLYHWNADGTVTHLGLVDFDSLTLTEVPTNRSLAGCLTDHWIADDTLLLVCDHGSSDHYVRAMDIATGRDFTTSAQPTFWLAADIESVSPLFEVEANNWVGTYRPGPVDDDAELAFAIGISRNGLIERITLTDPEHGVVASALPLDAIDALIYVKGYASGGDVTRLAHMGVWDANREAYTIVFPEPPGGAPAAVRGDTTFAPYGLDSWVVGH